MSLENLKCPNCGSADVRKTTGRTYQCSHCGGTATLSQDQNILILAQRLCPNCGAKVKDNDVFCSDCGATLSWPCPSCKKDVPIDAKFCSSCGKGIEYVNCYSCNSPVLAIHHKCYKCNAPLQWNCPNCDRQVRVEQAQCSHCKNELMPKSFSAHYAALFDRRGWHDIIGVQKKASPHLNLPSSDQWIVASPKVARSIGDSGLNYKCMIVTPAEILSFDGRGIFLSASNLVKLGREDLQTIRRDGKNVYLNNWTLLLPNQELAVLLYGLAKHIRNSPYSTDVLNVSNSNDRSSVALQTTETVSAGMVDNSKNIQTTPVSTVQADSNASEGEDRSVSDGPVGASIPWYTGIGWTILVALVSFVTLVVSMPPEYACLVLILALAIPTVFLVIYRKLAIRRRRIS